MSKYWRNRTGTIVHYSDCTKVTENSKPWRWADGKSDALIASVMAERGISPCRLCYPPLFPTRAHLRVVSS